MRIQFTGRDRHLAEALYAGALLLDPDSALTKILGIALSHRGDGLASVVSARCRRCGVDVFGVNPCRDEIEAVGWCGCKAPEEAP